jgi:hypothetical protein
VDFLGARLAVLNMPDGVRRLVTSKALDLRGRVIRSRLPRPKKVIVPVYSSRSRWVGGGVARAPVLAFCIGRFLGTSDLCTPSSFPSLPFARCRLGAGVGIACRYRGGYSSGYGGGYSSLGGDLMTGGFGSSMMGGTWCRWLSGVCCSRQVVPLAALES